MPAQRATPSPSVPRFRAKGSWCPGELTYVVRADLAEHGELVVDDHICG